MTTCRCGKPAHPLYAGRCEDCWALDNQYLIDTRRDPHRAISGIGDDTDSAHISNQGPRSKRWKKRGTQ